MSHRRPRSSAPSTVSNSASSPAAWPSVRLRPRARGPAAVAVHHARDVRRGCGRGRSPGGEHGCEPSCALGTAADVVDRWRARWPAGSTRVLRVTDRFGAVGGGPLSASIALSTFLSLFPLLLVGDRGRRACCPRATTASPPGSCRDLGLRGAQRRGRDRRHRGRRGQPPGRDRSSGVVGLLWSGLGVVGSLQTAINAVWQETGPGPGRPAGGAAVAGRCRACCSWAAPRSARSPAFLPGWAAPLLDPRRPGA